MHETIAYVSIDKKTYSTMYEAREADIKEQLRRFCDENMRWCVNINDIETALLDNLKELIDVCKGEAIYFTDIELEERTAK